MSTIPVQLPDELHAFIQARIADGKYATASDYIVALVDAARRSRLDIEAALQQGLNSGPAEEWTERDWHALRQKVIASHAKG